MITVVGLGREKGDITKNALAVIKNADVLFVRTLVSNAGKQIKRYNPTTMDDLYESVDNFDELNAMIVDRLSKATGENIVYCVDGDGSSDSSVEFIASKGLDYRIVQGVSDAVMVQATAGNVTLSSTSITKLNYIVDTALSLSITNIYDKFVAGDVKLYLLRFYDYSQKVFLSNGKTSKWVLLEDIDRDKKYSYNASIFVPSLEEFKKDKYSFNDLVRVVERLTAIDGCEWDKVQTHKTIANNVVEEAYELAEAIAQDDIDNMQEESGDIILQGVLHADIGRRYDEFTIDDVVDGLCKKLVSRHTHIFGEDKATSDVEAMDFWEKAKATEKQLTSLKDKLGKIPSTYPSVLRLQKALSKIKKEGVSMSKDDAEKMLLKNVDANNSIMAMVSLVLLNVISGVDTEIELLNKTNEIIKNASNKSKDATIKEIIGD